MFDITMCKTQIESASLTSYQNFYGMNTHQIFPWVDMAPSAFGLRSHPLQ